MHKTREMRLIEDEFGRDIRDVLFEYRWGANPKTLEEIGDMLGVSWGTVWNWLRVLELNVKQVAWKSMRDEVARVRVVSELHEEEAAQ
ncbi:MAG: hypothetical protein LBJ87_07375 [bacterium]|jgi:hypothetical protein|nr:hypothetical protein [bacterium]